MIRIISTNNSIGNPQDSLKVGFHLKTTTTSQGGNKDNAIEFLLASIMKSNTDIERIYVTRIDGMPVASAGRDGDHPDKDLISAQIAAISNTTSQSWFTCFTSGKSAKRVIVDGDDGTLYILRFRDNTHENYVVLVQVILGHRIVEFLSSLEMLDRVLKITDLSKFLN